ncbi:(E)-4-hydroxy-3-methylbut-2-enyl-diphosphate synthase [Compostibacter hankyongensis]|uniref:4-hydroxy-3-methylbut-2-en-1-yl diphosphate synthase (flavodoxin) n=1 Tax=Compostibacter hankyongensis TaxID=1007089 RepID=A0ABP8G5P6_9BACT
MQSYCESLTHYQRLKTLEVRVGDLLLGNFHPIRIQTMTTTDTLDTQATVEQSIRCIEAGAELVRITAPSKKEAENLRNIRDELRRRGYHTPLVADIHFTPNAAEIAARIVEKVRVNPGNYVDKKKFEFIAYTDADYRAEIDRIRERFSPLVKICKEYGTAMRIGTNHGSLSDRIMSRYGDTPMGMVESAMEFLRIAEDLGYYNIVLSMKSSNPQVMVQAYRLLIRQMQEELGHCYPLHLGVTEAGDGEDGRIKSAIGIGALLEDGIGDTIRVSLTEEPEYELPVCRDLVKRYTSIQTAATALPVSAPALQADDGQTASRLAYDPFAYRRRDTFPVGNTGGKQVPVVVADFSAAELSPANLRAAGYTYDAPTDKWHIGDAAADYLYTGNRYPAFPLPGTLRILCDAVAWDEAPDAGKCFPLFTPETWLEKAYRPSPLMNFITVDVSRLTPESWEELLAATDKSVIFCLHASGTPAMSAVRQQINDLMLRKCDNPVILRVESRASTVDEQLIHFATEAGALLLDGMGDGIWLENQPEGIRQQRVSGRTYLEVKDNRQFLNNTAFSILQATRTRISKTEYISCPSCGRTLFDLQETTAKIREVTHHLKGVKIAIMGCIVNGPGEMADADFGYVGSGPGKITLYKGKEVIKRNVPSATAVDELIDLLKVHRAWTDPA